MAEEASLVHQDSRHVASLRSATAPSTHALLTQSLKPRLDRHHFRIPSSATASGSSSPVWRSCARECVSVACLFGSQSAQIERSDREQRELHVHVAEGQPQVRLHQQELGVFQVRGGSRAGAPTRRRWHPPPRRASR